MACKKILLLITLTLTLATAFSQQKMNNYDKSWKKADSLINKAGLLKSALNEVNIIYTSAKKEGNEVQLIKALLYRIMLNDQVSDQGKYENIATLEKEIGMAKEPSRSILNSLAAGTYWNYLQMNRWQFYNRTATVNFKKEDLATWTVGDLNKRIADLYLASLHDTSLLKKTKLDYFDPIIIKGNSRALRPTLFDLLAHRALDYFKNDERNVSKPVYAFEINDPAVFSDAQTFAAHLFKTSDSLSLHHKALELFQQLITFHLNDLKPDALIDADLERIQFANSFSIQENKKELTREALERLVAAYPNAPEPKYLLALSYMEKARTYDPLSDTSNRYAFIKAKELCTGSADPNCSNLLQEIMRREIKMETEKVNVSNEPFRALVSYRNFTSAYFRLIRLDKKTKEKLGNETWDDKYWNQVIRLPALNSFDHSFPDTKDHQLHRVEIKIPGLPAGEYALLASPDKEFELKNNTVSLQYFYVSDISYVNNSNKYYVLNRKTGAPLEAAIVQLWQRKYDYQKRTNILRKSNTYTTDKNGFFIITDTSNKERNFNHQLEISYGNDKLFLDDEQYIYTYPSYNTTEDPDKDQTFLFTDRSLYRPGQIIYFKGIVAIKRNHNQQPAVIADRKTVVKLYNNNNEASDSLILTTNAFGSYSGKFVLPAGLLNGDFVIRDEHNSNEIQIRVEEYKRPTFSAEIPKPSGTYRVMDTIQLEGIAKAYAGNVVNGASVTYRVTRRTVMPYMYGYRSKIWPPYQQQQTEIAHGTTLTDENGKFTIPFQALPDNSISKKQDPLFYYEVSADITDINGETRSASSTITVAYKALNLELTLPAATHTDSFRVIKLSTTNMNDVFEKATVNITIHKLTPPARIFRERLWEQPDQFIMNREEYYKNFPYDIYSDETDMTKWAKDKKVFETTLVSSPDSAYKIPGNALSPGWYVAEAITKDKYGDTVRNIKYMQLYNAVVVSPFAAASLTEDKTIAQPGEKINYSLLTNLKDLFVLHELTSKEGEKRELVKDPKAFQLNISEKDLGEIAVSMLFVKNNRVYSGQSVFEIPFYDKQLTIQYTTFRDKTLPGANETWKVKISGHKGEKVAAELLTSMYDASLDQFYPHAWSVPNLWWMGISLSDWDGKNNFTAAQSQERVYTEPSAEVKNTEYDRLMVPDEGGYSVRSMTARSDGKMYKSANATAAPMAENESLKKDIPGSLKAVDGEALQVKTPENPSVQPRKNLNETAFFFPDLHTDSSGNVEFSFVTPEALTEWKWMLLTHTKGLAFGSGEKRMITQKELMVQPNAPRFLRAGDRIDLIAKVVNMTDRKIKGEATLQLIDPFTGLSIDNIFQNKTATQTFSTAAKQSDAVTFNITIPADYTHPVTWKIIATSGKLSDGEEAIVPVISNRMLVTETLPLPVKGTAAKNFKFEKLLQSGNSSTLQQHALTIEFTTNPAWYAIQALPYLAEGKTENAEQVFNRYYANALAASIANTSPRFRKIIDQWKTSDTAALLSNLQKNEELKSLLLQETPWVLEAKTESQQRKNIALLFDMVKMSAELHTTLNKLKDMQSPNGGFVWYKGGPDDRYMTQYILSGIGHLKQLGAIPASSNNILQGITTSGISYLDARIKKDYDQLKKYNKKLPAGTISDIAIQYLYMRSFFTNISVPGEVFGAYNYYRNQSKKAWLQENAYLRGMISLSLFRTGDVLNAKKIIAALKETAINKEELGMYWKDMNGSYYWHQAPVESQSVLIEAFSEVTKDTGSVNNMKTWLLKNKQTNSWKTSKATADACYALLLNGSDWINNESQAAITIGDTTLYSGKNATPGTGYFKSRIEGKNIKAEMGNIVVKIIPESISTTARPAWGSVYWQYFEELDKITSAATPLQLTKNLFVEKNSGRGPVLEPITGSSALHTGDKVKVRIELKCDRDMEYVHMKDMRGSCMEPVNVLSGYKWQDGLGYYESTRDASTDFFFSVLPKGVYVFEYTLFVTHTGTFSNGITTIQSMYAPEFSSHSEGIKLNVTNR